MGSKVSIAHNVAALFDESINVKFVGYDLSAAGNTASSNVFNIKSPQALQYIQESSLAYPAVAYSLSSPPAA